VAGAIGLVRGLSLLTWPEREEAALWRHLRDHARAATARTRLFNRYVHLARSVARKHVRRNGMPEHVFDDAVQFAFKGLLEAIDRFDPERGVPFAAFARPRLNGAVLDGIGRMDERGAQLRFRRRAERERLQSLMPAGDRDAETAIAELTELITELALGLMLDAEMRHGPNDVVGLPDNGFDRLAWREMQGLLLEGVRQLPDLEQTVVRQHYENDLLFSEIATMLDLSRGRISQLHKSALARLRKSMKAVR